MSSNNKQFTLNSLYIPLIIAIPANIFFLIRLHFGLLYSWGWVTFAVFTLFLFITGGLSVKKRERKAQMLGWIYLIAAVVFLVLAIVIA
ncbi:hypothetical protein [Sediminibacillus massiliensis]|uniref:hypothetical protein n=1 Tax=Sediminibacillus massiliensis TaxID=1926277 RepID=UPI000988866D|nr:hypothetical protein [Sediminibacillus massiliensis]